MRLLLTNDDGIEAAGLHALRDALLRIPGLEVMVVAPDGNRSATGRSITTRRPIVSRHVTFADGGVGWAIDGTPVDCVRLGWHELAGGKPDLIVAGINHGANLGDDITYSGTAGAALEGHHLGLPGLAVSQVARDAGLGFTDEGGYDFRAVAAFAAQLVAKAQDVGLVKGTVLNVNAPAGDPSHAELTRLGRRVYKDGLRRLEGEAPERAARHGAAEPVVTYGNAERISIYGVTATHDEEPGTDLYAVARGHISVTPVTLRWTDLARIEELHTPSIDAALVDSGAHIVSDEEAALEAHGRTSPAGPLVQSAAPVDVEDLTHAAESPSAAE
ncbi:MAG: 5'/3'-nucleotidase SurE [Solirubrobacteraceae bacterium]|nr:5'/3'-nucleotidase SurE [Solirubrobacteraceae bacterium]